MPTIPTAAPVLRTCEHTYPGTPDQVRHVRADLRHLLGDCPVAADVILCASELAANAVLHTRSRQPGGTFTLRAEVHEGDYIWIEIEDGGGGWAETARHEHGRGLHIVRSLASDLGFDGGYARCTVWARFDWPQTR